MRQQNDLSTLLFTLFVHVADADGDIAPHEVQTLNNLLDDPRWITGEQLRRAVESMRADYADIWSDYDGGRMTISRQSLSEGLDAAFRRLPADEADTLHADLAEYTRRLTRRGGGGGVASLGRLGQVPLSEGRQRARQEVEALLHARAPVPRDKVDAPVDEAAAERPLRPRPDDEMRRPSPAVAGRDLPAPLAAQDAPRADWMQTALDSLTPLDDASGRMRVRCIRVVQETADVKTYVLAPVAKQAFRYKPGQFMTLEIPVEGGRVLRRSYTVSSSPSRPLTVSITVKRLHMGWASTWLYETMAPGMELDVLGPAGTFTCIDHPAEKLFFASAGSGITPVMSMLRYLADIAAPVDIVFLNNVRSPADIIFRHELLHLQAQLGAALQLHIVPAKVESGQGWNGLTGRLSPRMIELLVPDLSERESFVCGPLGYMAGVRDALLGLGYPMERFHEESFGSALPPPAVPRPAAPPPAAPPAAVLPDMALPQTQARQAVQTCEVVFSRSGQTVRCGEQDRILDVALSAGIPIDHACRSGACGTCRITRVSGEVTMGRQQVLSQDAVDAGDILACVATARGRVVVDA